MTLKRWDGAAWQDITFIRRWDGAAWQDVTLLKRWDGAAWQDITLPGGGSGLTITATGNPNGTVFLNEPAPASQQVQGGTVTVIPTSGTGPYTYAWTQVSGSTAITPNNTTGAANAFSAILLKNTSVDGVWRCTVTDSLSAVGTIDFQVTLSYFTDL